MSGQRSGPGEYWVWSETTSSVEVRFVGRGIHTDRREALLSCRKAPTALSWLRQIHSDRTVEARQGLCGEGDALITGRAHLALSVATADCVPILLAGPSAIAAIHAGWRGIVAGIVSQAQRGLGDDPCRTTAWVGPAIGPCCYEVGPDVASQVEKVAGPEVVGSRGANRPHLDLPKAVRIQLEASGLSEVRQIEYCTKCHPKDLWSYRREGPGRGRNFAFIWRRQVA